MYFFSFLLSFTAVIQKIFKDTSVLLFAQVFSKAIAFFYTVFLAQTLGVEQFGIYTFAFSIFALISAISEFGISRYLIREIALEPNKAGYIFSQVAAIRVIFVAITYLVFLLLSFFWGLEIKFIYTLLLLIGAFPQSIALSFDGLFVGLRKIKYSAFGLFFVSLISSLFGWILLEQGYGLVGAVMSVVVAQFIYALSLYVIFAREKLAVILHLNRSLIKNALKGSLIYGLLSILGLLYFRIDTIMLSLLKGDYQTGLYGAAYRFLEAVLFVPAAVNAVIFPIFAKLHAENESEVKKFYYKFLKIMVGMSLLVLVGYLVFLPIIIKAFLPSFIESISSIKILSLSIPFMFAHVPATLLLTSSEKYLRTVLIISIFTLLLNIGGNLILIEKYGFIGASIMTAISEAISFIIFFIFLQIRVFRK